MDELSNNAIVEGVHWAFRNMFRDAAQMVELREIIDQHLMQTRKLYIVYKTTGSEVRNFDDNNKESLFESHSFTACIEWALKQPMIVSDAEAD